MPSARETALQGLFTVLDGITGPTVYRNNTEDPEVPDSGMINQWDGEPGEPEVTMSPTLYEYDHPVEVEVFFAGGTSSQRDTGLDNLLQLIGAAIAADRTLGGTVAYARVAPSDPEGEPVDGGDDIKAVNVFVIMTYTSSTPLS